MALQAKQTIQQRLMLTPNVTLALEILRMPTQELSAFLERQLEENPLLEVGETDEQDEESGEAAPEESNGKEEQADTGFGEDWLSHWRTAGERENRNSDDRTAEDTLADPRLTTAQSLHESLKLQLGCQTLTAQERQAGELLIDRLDQYGYLEEPLEELATEAGVPLERLETGLKLLQRFDPPGVGARNLRECLMLQLQHAGAHESLAYRILRDHFELFVQHRIGAIAKATGTGAPEVTRALEHLKQLDPKPGRVFVGDLPPSIIPDLVIHKREKHYDVELNDQEIPRVAMSRFYYRMLKDPRTPSDAKAFLTGKFRQASWLIKAIDERNTTLLSIARCLISLQRDFLEHGQHAFKPLTQTQVATLIGRHASTVSRAIAGKTIDTPYGIFFLEQFFASAVPQHDNADSVSDATIKSEIRRLVAQEHPQRPLSDAAFVTRLAERHIVVARRTIAKYRTSLKILPAYLRKRRF